MLKNFKKKSQICSAFFEVPRELLKNENKKRDSVLGKYLRKNESLAFPAHCSGADEDRELIFNLFQLEH